MKLVNTIKENRLLAVILVVATVLRLYHLNFQSIWLDEIYTMKMTDPDLGFSEQISEINQKEGFPYLYFLFLKLLNSVFVYSPVVARLFSAVMGILGVFAMYKFGKLLFRKNVGLIAAAITGLCEYCIFTSQDARPYSFYFFSVIVAFYFLVKLLKEINLRNAIIYGLATGFLLNTNFFSLVNVFSQYLIILLIIILSEKPIRINLLKYSCISGIIALLLFIPNYKMVIKLMNFESGWIPAPTNESLSIVFKELMGGSEATLFIIMPLFFYYLFDLFKLKEIGSDANKIINNEKVFGSIILGIWSVVLVWIIYWKSYTDTSIMIPRYFTSLLPVFILIISVGISLIRNRILKVFVFTTLCFFMLSNLVFVKRYYVSPTKTQFREAADFVIQNNSNKEKTYTSLKYFFDYFFDKKTKIAVEEVESLEAVLKQMELDSTKIKSFWYVDAHGRPFKLSAEVQQFLDKTFYLENNFDGIDAWTKHYILLKDGPSEVDLTKYGTLAQKNGDNFVFNIDGFDYTNNILKVNGWAFFDQQPATTTKIDIVLIHGNKAIRVQTKRVVRSDVTVGLKSDFDLDQCGFDASYDLSQLPAGQYPLGILLLNKNTGKEGLIVTDKLLQKN